MGYLQKYDKPAFHILDNNGNAVSWISYGQISECPPGVDGDALGCRHVCNLTDYNDNHGCQQRKQCYILGNYMTMDNCESWPVGRYGNSHVVTCDVGAGGIKYKYKLKQCAYKYSKRTVKCCQK